MGSVPILPCDCPPLPYNVSTSFQAGSMPQLKLSFLGTFQVTLNGQPVRNFRVNAARALLAYLAVEAD